MIPTFHPPLPQPIESPEIRLQILTPEVIEKLDEEVRAGRAVPYTFVALSWEDYLQLGLLFKAVQGKFEEYNSIICYYRKSLKEPTCAKYTPPVEQTTVEVEVP